MRVAVVLRSICDPSSLRVSRGRGVIETGRARPILAAGDRRALEEALRLHNVGAHLVGLGLGSGAEGFLREAAALGVDELIHLRGEGMPHLELDESPWIELLAEGFERRGAPDLVLVGHRLNNRRASPLGPRLAERLGWPLLTRALQVEMDSGGQVRARCAGEKASALWEAPLPCVVTIEDGPRSLYAPLPATMAAGPGELEVWMNWASGNAEKTVETVDTNAAPEVRGEKLAAEPRRLAQALAQRLRRWGLLD
ncbi:MAG: hypothetical protein HYZ68_01005 [Chloroflexi bacterium]|nr:hypothetical protein [Chloroflexota bacterium]